VVARGIVAEAETASVTLTVKLEVAAFGTAGAAGVPVITPAALKVKPAGRVPDATAQVYGVVPPVAASGWL
jgi:hypothetical protein